MKGYGEVSANIKYDDWKIEEKLGEGSFGQVYKISRTSRNNHTSSSALKVLSIPKDRGSFKNDSAIDDESYINELLNNLIKEIDLMDELKSNPNIVRYEDHRVIKHTQDAGYDVLIRMELLTPLSEYVKTHSLTELQIIQMGQDICNALTSCEKKKIIHRDIKPSNIFIDENGNFKLGDFGIARVMEESSGDLTNTGSPNYMAPEIPCGRYDSTVDIYSLGMVLYYYLNQQRLPFEPAGKISLQTIAAARTKRMIGEKIPAPNCTSETLKDAVITALNFDSSLRFRSAAAFSRTLEFAKKDYANTAYNRDDDDKTELVIPIDNDDKTEVVTPIDNHKKNKNSNDYNRDKGNRSDTKGNTGNGGNKTDKTDKLIFYVLVCVIILLLVIVTYLLYNLIISNTSKKADNHTSSSSSSSDDSIVTDDPEENLPDGVVYNEDNGHYYQLFNKSMTWTKAESRCESKGGYLATVTSAREQDFIENLIEEYQDNNKYHFWLGGTDRKKEGNWCWITGESFDYENWETGDKTSDKQPNNSTERGPEGQDYLEIQATSGNNSDEYMTWTDIADDGISPNCMTAPEYNDTQYYGYICEWDTEDMIDE